MTTPDNQPRIVVNDNELHDAHVWTWIRECWLADETNPGPMMMAEAYYCRT